MNKSEQSVIQSMNAELHIGTLIHQMLDDGALGVVKVHDEIVGLYDQASIDSWRADGFTVYTRDVPQRQPLVVSYEQAEMLRAKGYDEELLVVDEFPSLRPGHYHAKLGNGVEGRMVWWPSPIADEAHIDIEHHPRYTGWQRTTGRPRPASRKAKRKAFKKARRAAR